MTGNSLWQRLRGGFRTLIEQMHQPVDIASLVIFRIGFGYMMLWEVWRYFRNGWIDKYWIYPKYNFTYLGFDWVKPWPEEIIYYHFAFMGVLAIFIIVGFLYRISTIIFAFSFTYFFLLEQTRYLNHFYLTILIAFLMVLIPAHRCLSVDNRLGLSKPSNTAPAWAVWILQIQMAIVYFYGGIAKINVDWILRGEPIRMWLRDKTDFPIIGGLFSQEPFIWSIVYGGVLFDLLIAPFLFWKRTRLLAFIAAVGFHLTNAIIWKIGIFPWFAIVATTIFFAPNWPRTFFKIPTYKTDPSDTSEPIWPMKPKMAALNILLIVFTISQLVIPFRHHLYPGPVYWTEEGHQFSWRMKLRSRRGMTTFFVTDNKTGELIRIHPEAYLTQGQYETLQTKPDIILQFVEILKKEQAKKGRDDIMIRAVSTVSINGRPRQILFDPELDLTTVKRSFLHVPWFAPFDNKLE
ncbi:MAG: HTTM domain-containing protein [Verrucomicrobiota bacterium]